LQTTEYASLLPSPCPEPHRYLTEFIDSHLHDLHVRYTSGRGAKPKPINELIHGVRFGDRKNFDTAIREISGITSTAELDRFLPRRCAIEHALHPTRYVTATRNDHPIQVPIPIRLDCSRLGIDVR
jgi:hypothetical protein